jgi:LSD1 subclass zinc finger protein
MLDETSSNETSPERASGWDVVFGEDIFNCPRCSATMDRISRHPLMRVLPGSKHYRCANCSKRYLLFLGKPVPL